MRQWPRLSAIAVGCSGVDWTYFGSLGSPLLQVDFLNQQPTPSVKSWNGGNDIRLSFLQMQSILLSQISQFPFELFETRLQLRILDTNALPQSYTLAGFQGGCGEGTYVQSGSFHPDRLDPLPISPVYRVTHD